MNDSLKSLVRMANQIADFYTPYPPDRAASGVREHIIAFWSPRMRDDLACYVENGGSELRAAVLTAMKEPSSAASPTHRAVEDSNDLGELASDAG